MRDKLSILSTLLVLLALPVRLHAQWPEAQAQKPEVRTSQGATAAGASMLGDPVFGGVPTGQATGAPIALSLADAIERGLQHNLAGLLGSEGIRTAEAWRRRSRSRLLPNLNAAASNSQLQVNLRAMGFSGFPGIPTVVGPFSVSDARVYLSQTVIDWRAINDHRAASEKLKASEFSYRSIRDRIVYVCGDLYLQAVAGKSRIEAARMQLKTAQSLYDLAVDQKQAGVAPGIEVLRAQVQLQTQQQRLIAMENEFAKQKLNLARAIGLPVGQEFDLTDLLAHTGLVPVTPDQALERAYRDRADYQGALAQVRAAEAADKAARAERLPTFGVSANYGTNGPAPGWSHGSYTLAATVRIPIYQGGQTAAGILEAESVLKQRESELASLRGQIYYEIQTAFLNLRSAEENVKVAGGVVKLAGEQLDQAQDRFAAGVASNIEVVQAQEALAGATEAHISSLYAHVTAKGRLALALGAAESSFLEFVRGHP